MSIIEFGGLSILFFPIIVLEFFGKKCIPDNIFVNFVGVILLLGLRTSEMKQFIIFICCELILIYFYYNFKKRCSSELVYYLVIMASMLPILLVKSSIYLPNNTIGFLGISYISFKIWELLIEIHDNHVERLPITSTIYHLTFIASFSSGPITRFNNFISEYDRKISGIEYWNDYFCIGIKKIFWGAVYKFAFAFMVNTYFLQTISADVNFFNAIRYMYAYTLYLFFDFAGYSLLAIGTGRLLGIKLPENFNKPFLAKNMKEFWERWHISLSTWFRDFIFSRFVLNNLRNGLFKNKNTAARCGYMVTMITMGIWHGFTLHYILYGFYQGLMLVITDIYIKSKIYRKIKKKSWFIPISCIVCFNIIAFGMLLFSGFLFQL